MKKIYIILAVASLLATTSCTKFELNAPEAETRNTTVIITVSDLQPGTKAIKTSWANGDIIHVYLDDATSYQPDFDLTYDGTKWVSSEILAGVALRLKATGGKIRGFWEDSNYCMISGSWNKYGSFIEFPGFGTGAEKTTGVVDHLVADFSNIDYTYSGGVLTANINSWRFRTNLQIVISGLPFQAGRYSFYSDCMDNFSLIDTQTNYSPYDCHTSYMGTGSSHRIAGIANDDGTAFVGGLSTNYSPGETLTFYLVDGTTGTTYSFTKQLTTSISRDESKILGIKIPFAKFTVDMGLSVKWAACNLGAHYLTDYGDYFAWGETAPYYSSLSPLSWKVSKEAGYVWASYDMETAGDGTKFSKYTADKDSYATSGTADGKTTLDASDDAVTAAYGGSYRMPSDSDFDQLLDESNCTKEWVNSYLGTGINGYLFTSLKSGYTSQKLFFPAAGECGTTLSGAGISGTYWSSSLYTNDPDPGSANILYFNSTFASSNYNGLRYAGRSIRPVSE